MNCDFLCCMHCNSWKDLVQTMLHGFDIKITWWEIKENGEEMKCTGGEMKDKIQKKKIKQQNKLNSSSRMESRKIKTNQSDLIFSDLIFPFSFFFQNYVDSLSIHKRPIAVMQSSEAVCITAWTEVILTWKILTCYSCVLSTFSSIWSLVHFFLQSFELLDVYQCQEMIFLDFLFRHCQKLLFGVSKFVSHLLAAS